MIKLHFLGGVREVGRSSIEVNVDENMNIILDCGINPGGEKEHRYPLQPSYHPNYIIVTHAHLDHSGYVPIMAKKYQTKILATPPTQDISEILFLDMIKIEKERNTEIEFDSRDVTKLRKVNVDIRYRVPYNLSSSNTPVKMIMFNAGHILGSSMVYLKINKKGILYTGDFCMSNTRTLQMVDLDLPPINTLIIESTYSSPSDRRIGREKIEKEFIRTINDIYKRGGKALVAVFAVGRAQEVQLVLEAYMRSKAIPRMSIYLGGLVTKINRKYKLFWEWLKPEIQKQIRYTYHSPLESKFFTIIKNRSKPLKAEEPIIIVVPSGMLQGGLALYYFKHLAQNSKNAIILTGYQIPGTIGRKLLDGEKEITINGKKVEVRAEIKNFEFSAHSDVVGLFRFISHVKEKNSNLENIILVHGEEEKQLVFAKKIEERLKNVNVYVPKLDETIEI
ncbi:MAG: MBL fold metallo-hydrolase RNA specificity domain-containing protein [Candidatus Asgardarchaeum sp.]